MSEVLQPGAVLPKPKRVLVIGAEPKIEDFMAWYLLYVMHGDQLVSVFADEDTKIPAGVLDEEFDAIFLLNHFYDDPALFLEKTKVLFVIYNLAVTNIPNPEEKKPVYWTGKEKSFEAVFQTGDKEFSHVYTSVEVLPGTTARRSLASCLVDALSAHRLGTWWTHQPVTVIESPVLPMVLAGKGAQRFAGLMTVLRMLDNLPSYANRGDTRLHDKLESTQLPQLLGSHDTAPAGMAEAGYAVLDEFFKQDPL